MATPSENILETIPGFVAGLTWQDTLTPDLADALIKNARIGFGIQGCARLCRVKPDTLHDWLTAGVSDSGSELEQQFAAQFYSATMVSPQMAARAMAEVLQSGNVTQKNGVMKLLIGNEEKVGDPKTSQAEYGKWLISKLTDDDDEDENAE